MKRRTFIWIFILGAIALVIPWFKWRNRKAALNKKLSTPVFLAQLCEEREIRKIGNEYLKEAPAERRDLVTKLLTDRAGHSLPAESTEAMIQSLFEENIAEEFRTGKTVIAGGWVVSITEARQCALYAITQ